MEVIAKKMYEDRRMRLAVFGLSIALVAAVANTTFQNFNVAATGLIGEGIGTTLIAAYVLSVFALGICELIGGILVIAFNVIVKGCPLAEYGRILGVKSSRTILLSAVLGGPIATACAVMAVAQCGSTYANCIIGLTPAITAILGMIVLKEKTSIRVWFGIACSTVGVLIATFAPPEGVVNFYSGIALACVCPIAYTLENLISTHAVDVSDPMLACPMYRMIGSAFIEFIVCILVCAVTGHLDWIGTIISLISQNPLCMFFILCTAVFMAIQYNGTYTGYTYCGATKATAILWTGTFWSVPLGFTMSAMNILDYNVTMMGIVGAILVVAGIVLIVAKPSELFSLRNN